MRKPTFGICENKNADQLRGNREADQRLCFRYTDSTIPLRIESEISSLCPSSVAVQPGLCRTRSETRTLVFSCRGSIMFFYTLYSSQADLPCLMNHTVSSHFILLPNQIYTELLNISDCFTPFPSLPV